MEKDVRHVELSRHCKICENLDFNINYGTRCGITGSKPDFMNKCLKIEFGENALKYIREVSVEQELIKQSKFDYIGSFVLFLLVSLCFIIGGVFLTNYAWEYGVYASVTFILIGIGIIVLSKSFGYLNMFREKNGVAKEKIKNLEDVLNLYNKKYRIDLKIKDVHGIKEIKSKVDIY